LRRTWKRSTSSEPIIGPGIFAKNFPRFLHEFSRGTDIFPAQTAFEKVLFECVPLLRRHITEQVALNG
jgi:hypothetical protein